MLIGAVNHQKTLESALKSRFSSFAAKSSSLQAPHRLNQIAKSNI